MKLLVTIETPPKKHAIQVAVGNNGLKSGSSSGFSASRNRSWFLSDGTGVGDLYGFSSIAPSYRGCLVGRKGVGAQPTGYHRFEFFRPGWFIARILFLPLLLLLAWGVIGILHFVGLL